MTVNDYLRKTRKLIPGFGHQEVRPCIYCNDGFSVSVQASQFAYCDPRVDDADFYSSVELGYPSEPIPELLEYRDGDEPDVNNVFGYVPVQKVDELLACHGGIKEVQDGNQA